MNDIIVLNNKVLAIVTNLLSLIALNTTIAILTLLATGLSIALNKL